jgi:hypothetical protein
MCKGDGHGDVEKWTMPADSKHLNSTLAISSFLGEGSGLLQKLGGVHLSGCGAPLHGKDRTPYHPFFEAKVLHL